MTQQNGQESAEPRARNLTSPARQVHQAVLAEFARTGQPPARSELERLARSLGGSPDAVLAELAEADAIVFNGHGEIRAAYPFSPVHTPIRVSWPGGPAAYAMCAIDALGMSTMLGHPVTISAAEPDTGRAIMVDVDGSQARWRPRSTVVFVGSAGDTCRPSADRSCGYINFFTSRQSARAWIGRHCEVTGRLLTREGALGIGIAQFGNLLPGCTASRHLDQVTSDSRSPSGDPSRTSFPSGSVNLASRIPHGQSSATAPAGRMPSTSST